MPESSLSSLWFLYFAKYWKIPILISGTFFHWLRDSSFSILKCMQKICQGVKDSRCVIISLNLNRLLHHYGIVSHYLCLVNISKGGTTKGTGGGVRGNAAPLFSYKFWCFLCSMLCPPSSSSILRHLNCLNIDRHHRVKPEREWLVH